ncbi:multifunctional oxoglutarate decarboxylase/oxoglutarate dehydrogenase thiamine pyrophosphate-binding subunit/dihydrolipoyllysine-residue succinyltransferase subunit [Pseudoglutamicibacter albus]|uniref:2-oxoglutarate dehydrogenase E1 component n=1 Tax=Pseudoglutamicibacter albus TaxID=98671 RepID=A0ABU1YZG9_9MICC|nr:multifunctional oxoglutarate decarboxylase/oxoglutarate dehydrogenase thiamine pyrophosphate-binding subunit/dihydrolipoyllysine-residue succinyltransferase subunit [Pseudoglutamicibacter albus]MDR7293757.1 2-oxoglutarate dehydrogenase E1 component [Pseudoglutamicibacter albus]
MSDVSIDQLKEEFGGNEWLVDELYQKFLSDPSSVDEKWRSLFEQVKPEKNEKNTAATSTKQAAPAANKPAKKEPTKPASTSKKASSASKKDAPAATPAQASPAVRPSRQKSQLPAQPAKEESPSEPSATKVERLRGPARAIAKNMDESLSVPTATTVRAVPAKLLIDNRIVINNHLRRARGGKVSFTHLIGYAICRALKLNPAMNVSYDEEDGKPVAVHNAQVNFGIAIDLPRPDGSRLLVVPNIKSAENMTFSTFWETYEDIVKRGREGKLTAEDYAGTTVSLTNPGGLGTVHSVPRLSKGQATIIGVGALDYPAEYRGTSEKVKARNAVGKIITLTSTYDHRVIQGAASGEFLREIENQLLADEFWDEIFEALRIPYVPVRWAVDHQVDIDFQINKVARIQQLIESYRSSGHLIADTNPLTYQMRFHPDLDVQTYGLTLWDLDREWVTGGLGGHNRLPLRDILGILRDAYCRTTGIEYMHIQNPEEREWFQSKLERPYEKPTREEQIRILGKLNQAEAFETFLQTKYIGQKRFSLEGGESLIPLLDAIISDAADAGLDEAAIGMAHRGRLNVLTNIAGKTYGQVFREFEGTVDASTVQGSGDVKYHLGTEGSFTSESGNTTKIYLAANPSHLEAVDPVLEGIVRAKQDIIDRGPEGFTVLPILVHGDAAMIGQGVVSETLNLSQLRGYRTGGTIHVAVNNQVGFTTPPSSSRSSIYPTDFAKAIQAPVIHVNGDDPEAVVHAGRLAFEYREKFNRDVVIDLVCYRRRGHNEGDDPSMTQPLMYNLIDGKRSTRKLYTEALVGRGDLTQEEADGALKEYQSLLEAAFSETHKAQTTPMPAIDANGTLGMPKAQAEDADVSDPRADNTAITKEFIKAVGDAHTEIPEAFHVHPKLKTLLERRADMSVNGGIDWGFAELTAFASLTAEGIPVRLTGQDSRRGTFVQRHAVFHDRTNDDEWTPLHQVSENAAKFMIHDSSLSEYAVLGFEYGYSVERTDALVLWEAQFGDFVNGAQTIIDEFVSSGEQKWGQRSSVVMLLPHGYEGQGPDHSSARIERFLQLCAEDNMRVINPTTGANYFHALRRQAYLRPRKPMVVFTPKQLLRLKAAAQPVEAFTEQTFQPVIPDNDVEASKVKRVMLVSGRLYYDLLARRKKDKDETTAIVRVEQLYPLPQEQIAAELAKYPNADVRWVQDEPENQGPWPFMAINLVPGLDREVTVVSRPAAAAPSTGSSKVHAQENSDLLDRAFS